MVFEKSVTIRELPLASSNNYSALFESDGQVRKKTLGSIISQDIDDYLSGISVSFPTSIFNVASSSITPSDPNLVVSLKNQLAGTVFAAPETLNGTPSFRKLADVDLSETTVAFQDDISDNYLRLGSYTESQGHFTSSADSFSLRNTVAWASSSANRPNDTNSTIVAFTPYKSGSSEYGFFLGARNNRLWLSTLENSTPSSWVEIARRSEFDNYLPLSGGTMNTSAVINFNYQGGLAHAGSNRLRFTTGANIFSASVLSDTGLAFYFRPQGDTVTTGQVSIQGDGQINTSNHGNSSQWKQAYDWGNHVGLYLEKTALSLAPVSSWDTLTENRIVYSSSNANSPYDTYGVGLNLYGAGSMRGQIFINTLSTGNRNLQFRAANSAGSWSAVKTVWDNTNLTNVSQLNNDAGYITSTTANYLTINNSSSSVPNGAGLNTSGAFDPNTIAGSVATYTSASAGTPFSTGFILTQFETSSGNTALQLGNRGDVLAYRGKSSGNFGGWLTVASREWVTAQNYYNPENLIFGTGLNYNPTTGVLTSNQDSIFAYSPQGGLYTTDWSSTALGQHSIAIGYTSVVTASSGTSIGKGVFVGGAMSQNVGFSSNVNKALSANFGSYNLNNAELGNTFGQGLINQGMGLTVVGKYNQVAHHQTDMSVDEKTAAIQFGVGKDELTRRNAVTIFNDRRMDYDAQRDDTYWNQNTIPDIKWIQENISGGGGGGNMNFAYIDHTNTHAFGTDEANGLLIPASLISGSPAPANIISAIKVYTHDDGGGYSAPTIDTFCNPLAVSVAGDILVRRGCIKLPSGIDVRTMLVTSNKLVLLYDKSQDIVGLQWMKTIDLFNIKHDPDYLGIYIGDAFNDSTGDAYFNVNPQII